MTTRMDIPFVIHQMWLDKSTKFNLGPPAKFNNNVTRLQRLNPEFQYCFWNLSKVETLLQQIDSSRQQEPRLSDFFVSLKQHIEKCDFARYVILWKFGGFYFDLDIICKRSCLDFLREFHYKRNASMYFLNDLVDWNSKNFFTFAWPSQQKNKSVTNAVIISTKENSFWESYLFEIMSKYNELHSKVKTSSALCTTGPILLSARLATGTPVAKCGNDTGTTAVSSDISYTSETRITYQTLTHGNNYFTPDPLNITSWGIGSIDKISAYLMDKYMMEFIVLIVLVVIVLILGLSVGVFFGLSARNGSSSGIIGST